MVLYGSKYAYKREDGVLVVPLTCLKHQNSNATVNIILISYLLQGLNWI
ncbi:MAG: hypothetical protein WC177_01095 [Bacilli bacterium]